MKTIPTFTRGLAAALLSLCALPALAQENTNLSGNGWSYTASNTTLTITSDNAWPEIAYDNEKSDDDQSQAWLTLKDVVTSITIGDDVTKISKGAFAEYGLLSSVTMGNNVKYIGDEAFSYCGSSIEDGDTFLSVTLSTALDSVCSYAFQSSRLKEIDLSQCASLKKIGRCAFSNCYYLTSVKLPSSVEIIDDAAFSSSSNITTLDLSKCSALTTIGGAAFYYCELLKSLVIPASVTSIGNDAFAFWSALTSVTLLSAPNHTPDNPHIIYLGSECLERDVYKPLRDIEPRHKEESGSNIVIKCEYRDEDDDDNDGDYDEYFVIPTSATLYYNPSNTYIGDFSTTDNLRTYFTNFPQIYYEESSKTLAIFSTDAFSSSDYKSYASQAENLVFADDCQLTSIPASAFADFAALKNIILPKTLTEIGDNAFQSCTNLAQVTILSDAKTCNELNPHIITLGTSADKEGYGSDIFPSGCKAKLVYDDKTTYVGSNGENLSHYFDLSTTALQSPSLPQSPTLYYDLQGRPITNPTPNTPTITIRNGHPSLTLTK